MNQGAPDQATFTLEHPDGAGGQPAGRHAARLALAELVHAAQAATAAGEMLRAGILNGIERANQAVMGLAVGAATILVAVEVQDNSVRPYHVGDSLILVVGRRGKVKLQTIAHSPVGYAVESGSLGGVMAAYAERMCSPSDGTPSKPDDLACIVFRRIITKADAVAITIGRDSQCEQPEC